MASGIWEERGKTIRNQRREIEKNISMKFQGREMERGRGIGEERWYEEPGKRCKTIYEELKEMEIYEELGKRDGKKFRGRGMEN